MEAMDDSCDKCCKDASRCEGLAGPGTVNKCSNSWNSNKRLHLVNSKTITQFETQSEGILKFITGIHSAKKGASRQQ
jgi:hypothetical protein